MPPARNRRARQETEIYARSRYRQLTGAGPQRPKLIGIQRFFGLPGVIAGRIDVRLAVNARSSMLSV